MQKRNMLIATLAAALLLSCNKDTLPPGKALRLSEQMMIDGLARTYVIKLPKDYYDSVSERPLVIGLHGTGGSAEQFERAYGFNEKADAAGFVAVYADGVIKDDGRGFFKIRTWNAGTCCDYAMYNNINDVKFISTLIDSISRRFRINRKKVYVTGMSNGGMMAYRLASELPHQIAAIGVVSGTMVAEKNPGREGTVPVIHIHAVPDTKVPFNGGIGIGEVHFPPAMEGIQYWVNRNNCQNDPIVENHQGYQLKSWLSQDGRPSIQLYLTEDGGHAWPSTERQGRWGDMPSTALNATGLIWDFLNAFSRP